MSAASGDTKAIGAFVAAGADPNLRDPQGVSPLDAAALCSNHRAMRSLMKRGAAVDAVDQRGFTALHKVCENSEWTDPSTIRALLEEGAVLQGKAAADVSSPLDILKCSGCREARSRCNEEHPSVAAYGESGRAHYA